MLVKVQNQIPSPDARATNSPVGGEETPGLRTPYEAMPEAAVLIDVEAVASMLTCSTRHVRRLADSGKMPSPIKLGALLRWRRADIDAWLEGGCRPVRRISR